MTEPDVTSWKGTVQHQWYISLIRARSICEDLRAEGDTSASAEYAAVRADPDGS
jgi:hypothetical protein